MRIGIYGGSFNPIHASHIQLATHAARYFDQVWIMPCYEDYKGTLVAPEHRLKMCELACRNVPNVSVFDFEIRNKITGGTFEVLSRLQFNRTIWDSINPVFIVGKDAADTIESWQNWEKLISNFTFLVYNRSGAQPLEPGMWYAKAPHIYIPSSCAFDISSTDIRENLYGDNPRIDISWLVPPEVVEYIKEHNLYA